MRRRRFLLSAAVLAAMGRPALSAESLFSRPIRIVVPASPGGFTDIAARVLAEHLAPRLGQQVIVDNRAGAAGLIACEMVARSRADGTTFLMGTVNTHAMNLGLYKKLPYDPVKDFVPITRVATGHTVLVVPPALPVTDVRTLIELAKTRPGALSYGSGGAGVSSHLAGEMLRQMAGVELLHVPFRGTTLAVQALIGGQISMLFDTLPSALPHVQAGTLRALGVTSPTRLASLPQVPTVAETLPGFDMAVWVGLFAPAGLPEPMVDAMDRHSRAILGDAAIAERFVQMGFNPSTLGPREFADFTARETRKWTDVIRRAGVTLD